jgi:hypothetical protein
MREESFSGQTHRIGYGLFSRHEAIQKIVNGNERVRFDLGQGACLFRARKAHPIFPTDKIDWDCGDVMNNSIAHERRRPFFHDQSRMKIGRLKIGHVSCWPGLSQ